VVGIVQNITDQKSQEIQLQQHAAHDSLTGLPNRRNGETFLIHQLAAARRAERPLGICLFDLDHFKLINDMHGHMTGDRVLKLLAHFIPRQLRESDLVFRWGGEEFVVVCPDSDVDGVCELAQRIRGAAQRIDWRDEVGVERPVTFSMGIAAYPRHGADPVSLLTAADMALYRAKENGRDRIELA
jgi:diguanylate cyclase (GGDEF)-like protein